VRFWGEAADREVCLIAAERWRGDALPHEQVKTVAALQALVGAIASEEANTSVLAQAPLEGVSTFYGYYVLEARAKAGDYQGCLDVIRKYWGAMLDFGATTFWEDFDLSWTENAGRIDEIVPEGMKDLHVDYGDFCYKGLRHSLCHGWAGGPTAWLSEHVLGFRALEPGCTRLEIAPHLADLEWARGSFPTPLRNSQGDTHARRSRHGANRGQCSPSHRGDCAPLVGGSYSLRAKIPEIADRQLSPHRH